MQFLDKYLLYLTLTEREWDTDTQNPDSFEYDNFHNLLSKLSGLHAFKKMRHTLQPSMYSIYIKNFLGDYIGRPDSMNSVTMRHVGFNQFLKDLEALKKKVEYAEKIKSKIPNNFFKDSSGRGETNDPGDFGDDGGVDGGGD